MTLVKVKPGFSNNLFMGHPVIENLMKDIFNTETTGNGNNGATYSTPKVNIYETEKAYKLEMAVPGLSKKDISINVDNDILTITADSEPQERDYLRQEFHYGKFSRKFNLSEDIDQEGIKAAFSNGILEITLSKKEVVIEKPKKIKIS